MVEKEKLGQRKILVIKDETLTFERIMAGK